MIFTNSDLATYKKLLNHCSKRTSKIDTITVHAMAGNGSLQGLFEVLNKKKSSCNYGIDSKGNIGLYVEEKNRSWCSDSSSNDNRAITIEVANISGSPQWKISEEAEKALINLLIDICLRNNIKSLIWSDKKEDRINHNNGVNITLHKDYNNKKECPGLYIINNWQRIADTVNKTLKRNLFEYEKIKVNYGEVKGVIFYNNKFVFEFSEDITLNKVIFPYTDKKGNSGVYLEFSIVEKRPLYIKEILSESVLKINE